MIMPLKRRQRFVVLNLSFLQGFGKPFDLLRCCMQVCAATLRFGSSSHLAGSTRCVLAVLRETKKHIMFKDVKVKGQQVERTKACKDSN